MEKIEQNREPQFDLETYKRAVQAMIATNSGFYNRYNRQARFRSRTYDREKVERILSSGSMEELQELSRTFFNENGFYKQIIIYYATLLKYAGVLIPNPAYGKKLVSPNVKKQYFLAVDCVDKMCIPSFAANCAMRALVDGAYYGLVLQLTKDSFVVMDLPANFCVSNMKDMAGNDIIEFNLRYFNSIKDEDRRAQVLNLFPPEVKTAYKNFLKNPTDSWVIIPGGVGICFSFFDGRPLFTSMIPSVLDFKESTETEQERAQEEIKKIIVQKVPHLSDGHLLFEPEEAQVFHNGTVQMLKGNKNLSVLTTYMDVDAIVSKSTVEGTNSTLDRMRENIYANAGVSSQIFTATNSTTLKESIYADISLMMYFANKVAHFISNAVNAVCATSNVSFKYVFLPVSMHYEDRYLDNVFKMASSGYSLLVPSATIGISQKDLLNLKDLENKVLSLNDKLKPLASSYTMPAERGRPKKEDDQKADKTLENEASIERQGQISKGGSEE